MRLLVIEDEIELSKSICTYLGKNNFICEVSYDLPEAMQKIQENSYECILLDISLPKGNGLLLLQYLKEECKSESVLIISAKNSLDDKLEGLNLGADDYLTKPFHLAELAARVESVLRRKYFDGQNQIITDELTIRTQEKRAYVKGHPIDLTRKEYELLLYFVANKNKVVTFEAIVEHLWGDHIDMNDNYDFIYTHVKNLRKKITQNGYPDPIKAIYGMGYKFSTEPGGQKRRK
jgi:DNA-binding response OmpR family regulator